MEEVTWNYFGIWKLVFLNLSAWSEKLGAISPHSLPKWFENSQILKATSLVGCISWKDWIFLEFFIPGFLWQIHVFLIHDISSETIKEMSYFGRKNNFFDISADVLRSLQKSASKTSHTDDFHIPSWKAITRKSITVQCTIKTPSNHTLYQWTLMKGRKRRTFHEHTTTKKGDSEGKH